MATFVNEEAEQGYEARLSLFTVPPVETGIEQVYYKEFRPVGTVSGQSTLEFDIVNNAPDYMDLNRAELELTIKIKDDKGVPIKTVDNVGLVNLPVCSIFRQMDLSIQQQVVTTSIGNNFPYKALIDTLLGNGLSDATSWLTLGGFTKDTAGGMDSFDVRSTTNLGLTSRAVFTENGAQMMLKSRLMMDFAQQEKPLINGVPVNIKLYPALDRFRLMYDDPNTPNAGSFAETRKRKRRRKSAQAGTHAVAAAATSQYYTVEVSSAALVVPMIRLNPALLMKHNDMISSKMAMYPFSRSDIRVFNIPAADQVWTHDNLFQDMVPKRLIVGLVTAKAYAGHPQKNPFNFQTFDLSYLAFSVNGQIVTGSAFQPNFAKNHYVNEFASIFKWLTDSKKDPPNITYRDMKNGYALFVIDLEKAKGDDFSVPIVKGQTELSLRFSKELPENVTVIAYGIFDSMVRIDQARNVLVE